MRWEKVKLDKLGNISRGRSKHRPRNDTKLFGGDYPFIQTADVKKANFYIKEYSETYNELGLEQSKLWDIGTLCITIAANIADTGILGIPACFPDSIMGFVPYDKISDVRFVKYSFDLLQRDCKQISQGTAQDNLSWEKLSTIEFPCPPIETQRRIGDILSAYDDLIENNQKQIKLLEEAAQHLYKEWFVDLRFPGYEQTKIIDGVPEGWRKKLVKELGTVITGKTPSTNKSEYYGGNIPFVTIPDMHHNIFPLNTEKCLTAQGADSQKNKYIPKNSVMVSCIATVGLVNIATEVCQTNQQINSVILNNRHDIYHFYFSMRNIRNLLDGIGSNGATMTNVNKTKFENIEVLYPTKEYVDKFYEICEAYFNKILVLSKANQRLVKIRDYLIPKLMSGKIEV